MKNYAVRVRYAAMHYLPTFHVEANSVQEAEEIAKKSIKENDDWYANEEILIGNFYYDTEEVK